MVSVRIAIKSNRFPSLPARLRPVAAAATLAAAGRIKIDARGRYSATPGDTGEMRNKTTSRRAGELGALAESAALHAIYQDQGTRFLRPTRFFSGAAEAEAATFAATFAAEIRSAF